MINDRSPVVRRGPQQHFHHDRPYSNPNPNPNPKLSPKQHGSADWTGSEGFSPAMSSQPQFPHHQGDRGPNLASPSTGSSLSPGAPRSTLHSVSESGEARGASSRFKARTSKFPSSVVATAAAMKEAHKRIKVIVRHLPPGLSESAFTEEIGARFFGTYKRITFCPGKSSVKGSRFSRAYIEFFLPENVIDFFEGFNGHVFVNERGTQCKALVEYAPNQRVVKSGDPKKDTREGSIFEDPDYVKFSEEISKAIEYLPSAEAQLERKEIERMSSSGAKEAIIVTPLMEFVRQKRASKSMPQKSLAAAGKMTGRGGASMTKVVLKRGSERSRANTMYPGSRPKEKATYVPRYDETQRREISAEKKGRVVFEAKDNKILPEDSNKAVQNNQGASALKVLVEQGVGKGFAAGKKNSGALDKEELINGVASTMSGSSANGKSVLPVGRVRVTASKGPAGFFQNHPNAGIEGLSLLRISQRIESGGRIGNKGASSSKAPFLQKAEHQNDQDKRSSRAQVWKNNNREANASEPESGSTFMEDKNDTVRQDGKRLRNKDRPDRPVWTVRQRSDATDPPKSANVAPSISPPGNQRQGRVARDLDYSAVPDASKPPSKRAGSSTVYGVHEKQVWVAKPGSGS